MIWKSLLKLACIQTICKWANNLGFVHCTFSMHDWKGKVFKWNVLRSAVISRESDTFLPRPTLKRTHIKFFLNLRVQMQLFLKIIVQTNFVWFISQNQGDRLGLEIFLLKLPTHYTQMRPMYFLMFVVANGNCKYF